MKNTLYLLLTIIGLLGCHKKKICNSTNSSFNQLYESIHTNNPSFTDNFIMDLEVHAYTFSVSDTQEVCSIGYRAAPNMNSKNYKMIIVDSLSNTILYSENHLFSSTNTSYVTPGITIKLLPGINYTINRIQLNWSPSIVNTVGRVLYSNNLSILFPVSNGDITIVSSNFYGNGFPLLNFGVPYIDIVFKK
ncbi:MAG: hypothetical protein K0B10_12770 [Vicingaceae bacterium]|nr:hypothetical protein [Vicingaceae bacterium]